MLQLGDEKWIKDVVSPLAFKLQDGRVLVAANGERFDDPNVNYIEAGLPKSIFPVSQQRIEELVTQLKRDAHRSRLALSFADALTVYDSVVLESQRLGISGHGEKPDQDLVAWVEGCSETFARIDRANSSDDVKLPDFPPVPRWQRRRDQLHVAIDRIQSTKL
jgi:hypothetical protein